MGSSLKLRERRRVLGGGEVTGHGLWKAGPLLLPLPQHQRQSDVKPDRPSSHLSSTTLDKLQPLKAGKLPTKKKVSGEGGVPWGRIPAWGLRESSSLPVPPLSVLSQVVMWGWALCLYLLPRSH